MDYPISVPGVNLLAGKFTDGNPLLAQPASLDPASWANNVTEELLNVIRGAGLVPAESKSDQLLAAIRALGGSYLGKGVAGAANVSLSAIESDNGVIWFSGALTANIAVIMPAAERKWIIGNYTTGPFTLTVKTAAGGGVIAVQGASTTMFCNGTSVYEARPPLRAFDGAGIGVTAPVSLSVSQAGSWINVVAGVTVTLPVSDTAVGLSYLLRAEQSFTLASAGGLVGGLVSLSLAQGEWIEVTGNPAAGGGWYVTGRGQFDRVASYFDAQVFAALSAPTGLIAAFPFATAPAGWLKANGAAISRTSYDGLFAKIGTAYGVGNGSTTFNLPDLRGEFLRGFDDSRGVDTGRACGTSQLDALQNITGTTSIVAGGQTGTGAFAATGATASHITSTLSGVDATLTFDASRVVRTATETRPRNFAALFCIRY